MLYHNNRLIFKLSCIFDVLSCDFYLLINNNAIIKLSSVLEWDVSFYKFFIKAFYLAYSYAQTKTWPVKYHAHETAPVLVSCLSDFSTRFICLECAQGKVVIICRPTAWHQMICTRMKSFNASMPKWLQPFTAILIDIYSSDFLVFYNFLYAFLSNMLLVPVTKSYVL